TDNRQPTTDNRQPTNPHQLPTRCCSATESKRICLLQGPNDDRRTTATGVGPRGKNALEKMGPVSERTAGGDGAGRLQRKRRGLEVLDPRTCSLEGFTQGGRRARGNLGRPAAVVLRAGPLERERSDPQGAALRRDQQRREPRRQRSRARGIAPDRLDRT